MAKKINILVTVDDGGGMTMTPPTAWQREIKSFAKGSTGSVYFDPEALEYEEDSIIGDMAKDVRGSYDSWTDRRGYHVRQKQAEVTMYAEDFAVLVDVSFFEHVERLGWL